MCVFLLLNGIRSLLNFYGVKTGIAFARAVELVGLIMDRFDQIMGPPIIEDG
jgi:hypothetical protein